MTVVLTDELERRANNKDRVLRALRDAGPAGLTNVELVAIGGMRAVGGRLTELRAEGHAIETIREGGGLFRFVLHETPRPQPGTPGYLSSLPVVASIERHRVVAPAEDDTPRPGCLF